MIPLDKPTFDEVYSASARRVEYPFEQIPVDIDGKHWQATGIAILVEDEPFASYGCSALPGAILIDQIDRLDDSGRLEYEDCPLSVWTAQEQLMLLAAIAIKLNSNPDKLNQWFAERMDP